MTDAPTVSVVIPTFNRLRQLDRVLHGLVRQSHRPDFEVVVVSDGSTDGTDAYLRERAPLPVVSCTQENRGPAAARNRAIDVASGELIVFLDDDVVPAPDLVQAHVSAHVRHGERAVVIGPMLDPPDHHMSPWVRWEQRMLRKQYDAMQRGRYGASARQFYTGNASVYRRHLVAAGGFDERFRRAEDVELALRLDRAGLAFVFEPDAIGWHYAERTYESWRAAAAAYGHNDVTFAVRDGHAEILHRCAREFGWRNPGIRALTRLCIDRRRTTTVVERALRTTASTADRAGVEAIARAAMSGIFNVTYYQGVADELGGGERWWALVDEKVAA